MKKLTSLSVAVLLALGVAACKQADPAADYQAFQQWNSTQNAVQIEATQQFQTALQAAIQSQNKEAESSAYQIYATKVQDTIKALDAVKIDSNEVKSVVGKVKAYLVATSELMTESAAQSLQPTNERAKVIVDKVEQTKVLLEDAKAAQDALTQKYGTK